MTTHNISMVTEKKYENYAICKFHIYICI